LNRSVGEKIGIFKHTSPKINALLAAAEWNLKKLTEKLKKNIFGLFKKILAQIFKNTFVQYFERLCYS
jgi:hypothetical protein